MEKVDESVAHINDDDFPIPQSHCRRLRSQWHPLCVSVMCLLKLAEKL